MNIKYLLTTIAHWLCYYQVLEVWLKLTALGNIFLQIIRFLLCLPLNSSSPKGDQNLYFFKNINLKSQSHTPRLKNCKPTHMNQLDLTWLNRFLYFWVKWNFSASRFLNYYVLTRGFLLYIFFYSRVLLSGEWFSTSEG